MIYKVFARTLYTAYAMDYPTIAPSSHGCTVRDIILDTSDRRYAIIIYDHRATIRYNERIHHPKYGWIRRWVINLDNLYDI